MSDPLTDPPEVEYGREIAVSCCDNKECNSVHLRVYDVSHNLMYHCQMTVETSQWLVVQLNSAIEHRMHSNKNLVN